MEFKLKEYLHMYYIPIKNYNFKSQKFYLEHKGEIAKNLS